MHNENLFEGVFVLSYVLTYICQSMHVCVCKCILRVYAVFVGWAGTFHILKYINPKLEYNFEITKKEENKSSMRRCRNSLSFRIA